MFRIEFEKPEEPAVCECCGGRIYRFTRFVYQDEDLHAVYYAKLTDKHPDYGVVAVISLGKWWDDSTPADRLAFPLHFRADDDNYHVTATDAEESPWSDVEFLGRMLDREEALSHPLIDEVFHITDHIFTEDLLIRDYLDGKPLSL